MRELFDPGPAASLLADAWRSGTQLEALPVEIRPRTLSEGYDVQDRLIERLGEKVVGWKLGVGSPKAKRQAGLERAIAGRVLASSCHRSGDVIRLTSRAPLTVEFEVAFVLGQDIEPNEQLAAPHEAVSAAHVTVELVCARFVDRRAVGWPSFAADDAGFVALIVGDTIDPADVDGIVNSVVVSVDGEERAHRVADEDLIDPAVALGELLAHARERGLTLRRGDIVSTGTLSRPFDVAGDTVKVTARYLGSTLKFRTQAG